MTRARKEPGSYDNRRPLLARTRETSSEREGILLHLEHRELPRRVPDHSDARGRCIPTVGFADPKGRT